MLDSMLDEAEAERQLDAVSALLQRLTGIDADEADEIAADALIQAFAAKLGGAK